MMTTDINSGCRQIAQYQRCGVLNLNPMSDMGQTNMALETEHLGGLCHVENQGYSGRDYFRGRCGRGGVILPCRTKINHE